MGQRWARTFDGEASWGLLKPGWAFWGPSWDLSGLSWSLPGPSWGHLGAILGPSWALWGPSWSLLGPRVHGLFETLLARHELAVQLIADTRNHQTLHCGIQFRQGVLVEFEEFFLLVRRILLRIRRFRFRSPNEQSKPPFKRPGPAECAKRFNNGLDMKACISAYDNTFHMIMYYHMGI